jgi:pimeloyl-ACP methyl ester carboxylesterase
MSHVEFDWDSPIRRHWIAEFSRGRTLLRYDSRGTGLSDWRAELSFEGFVDDLESVVEAAGLERFDLLGISQGAAIAITYAVRHPERVRRMVLLGGFTRGWAVRPDPEEAARREAMMTLTLAGWGMDNPAFRQMFTSLFVPGGSAEHQSWFNELQRRTTSPENAARLQAVSSIVDVSALLGQVTVPTLVAHSRDDAMVPFEAGRKLARTIPGARFLALDSRNHILLEEEPAWTRFIEAANEFLKD